MPLEQLKASTNVDISLQDEERIRKKGSESHKERVEKFNAYLNSLSEHYEPAKVSWTKQTSNNYFHCHLAMAPYISKTEQYITDNSDLSNSSENSATVPLLRYIKTLALNAQ